MDITVIKWNAICCWTIYQPVPFRWRRSFTGVWRACIASGYSTQHCYIWKTLCTNSQTMQLCVPVQGMWLTVFPGVSLWVVHGTPRTTHHTFDLHHGCSSLNGSLGLFSLHKFGIFGNENWSCAFLLATRPDQTFQVYTLGKRVPQGFFGS